MGEGEGEADLGIAPTGVQFGTQAALLSQKDIDALRYAGAIRAGRFSTSRGHIFSGQDLLRGRLIEAVMCDFRIDAAEICDRFGLTRKALRTLLDLTARQFDGFVALDEDGLTIPPEGRPLTRMIARSLDAYDLSRAGHSSAV